MPRFERATDQFGFPIPAHIGDSASQRKTEESEFGSPKRGQLGPTGMRLKRWLIFGMIGVTLVVLLFTVFRDDIRNFFGEMEFHRGEQAMEEGDYDRARGHFDTALELTPEMVEARYLRAVALYQLKEFDEARGELEPLSRYVPSDENRNKRINVAILHARAFEKLAWIDFRQNKFENAIRNADRCVAANRNDAQSLNARAYLCSLTGLQLDQGLLDIDQAIKMNDRTDASLIDTRAYLHFKKGDLTKALDDMDQAIMLSTTEYRMAELRGFQMNRQASPETSAQLRRQLRENLGVMYHHRQEIHEALKNVDEAAADKAKAEEFGYDPNGNVF